MIPEGFAAVAEESLGQEIAGILIEHLDDGPMVSVRANTAKVGTGDLRLHFGELADEAVEWSENAFYLTERPSFTMDPLFHAGGYYVQEASSMYVGHLLRDHIAGSASGLRILDLCAAPGGKTTDILSLMRPYDILVTNEVMRNRVTILAENVAKWGNPNVIVTNCDPAGFKALKGYFDIAVIDAPCSGEGMFRKDAKAVAEWSVENVHICAARQRRIIADIWDSIAENGLVVYSTCTFNKFEDEENTEWIASEMGAEIIEQRHFIPGIDRGEGFYCALLRKKSTSERFRVPKSRPANIFSPASDYLEDGFLLYRKGNLIKAFPENVAEEMCAIESKLRVISSGVAVATAKGRDLIPEADLALSTALRRSAFNSVEVSCADALRFLAKEPILPEGAVKGYNLLTFNGVPLGFIKNIGNRANNLYPVSRRIRMDISSTL